MTNSTLRRPASTAAAAVAGSPQTLASLSTREFVDYLRRLGVALRIEGGALGLNAPKGVVTPALRGEILQRKPEILDFLTSSSSEGSLKPVSRDEQLPLSFAQESLWFLHRLEPDNPFYNIFDGLRLRGRLDVDVLRRCLQEVVRRHEALRTTFTDVSGQPQQEIGAATAWPLPVVDLEGVSLARRRKELARRVTVEGGRPFDLARGPLLRAVLLRVEETEHVLLLTVHHIIADAWSMAVLMGEVLALYEAFLKGRPSPLEDLPIQFIDWVCWQRQRLLDERMEQQITYWRECLGGAPTLLELPADRPRPPKQSYRGDLLRVEFPAALNEALGDLARQFGVTLYATLVAAFHTLLHLLSGQRTILVGSAVAGRNQAETEGLIGFFVNMLVLRMDFAGDPSFREVLEQARDRVAGAYAHQDLPFEKLVDALQPRRSLSHTPVFQVALVMQNMPMPRLETAGLELEPLAVHTGTTKGDLTLLLRQGAEGLYGSLEYSTDLFDPTTIMRLGEQLRTLLEKIVRRPERRLSDLGVMSRVTRHQLLVEWNGAAGAPRNREGLSFPRRFERIADEHPTASAVSFGDHHLSYQELNQRANRLAHHLRARGVRHGVPVAICAPRGFEMVVGLVGIQKAGGAYVPMDPSYPAARLNYLLRDCGAKLLLVHGDARVEPENDVTVLSLGGEEISRERDDNLVGGPELDDPAYMIYTSGSTGGPKGVTVSHRNLVSSTLARFAFYSRRVERFLLLPSFAFDSSVAVIFWTLWEGGALVVPEDGAETDLPRLTELLEHHRATHLLCLPSIYALLLEQAARHPLPDLLTAIVAGEASSAEVVARHHERRAHGELFNEYGPTEGTVWVTACRLDSADARPTVTIGRPIPGMAVVLLDRRGQAVPIGVAGEVCLSGAGLARGYHGRPGLTADRFRPHPFAQKPGERFYRTGDLARFRSDGTLDFLGRVDHQVKIRGFRIEPREIEEALLNHQAIRQVVVTTGSGAAARRLVAYVAVGQTAISEGDLRRFLGGKLPAYMVPHHFVILESLPITPNGKVDRAALPQPASPGEGKGPADEPTTEVESRLAAIWAAVLKLDKVGVRDNFFELGGDSILSIQVAARAAEAELRLTTQQLFEYQTIAELAPHVGGSAASSAPQGPVTGTLPLTPIQRWFFEQDFPRPAHWNQAVFLEPAPDLDPRHLEHGLTSLLRHHDALRSRFERDSVKSGTEGVRQHVVAPGAAKWSLTRVDHSGLGEEEEERRTAIANAVQASLDLEHGPLARAVYFDRGGNPARLLLVLHHLVVDGVSWRILLEQLNKLCQSSALPMKTTSYKEWAEKLSLAARSEAIEAQQDHWLKPPPVPVGSLVVDHPEGNNTVASGTTVVVSLGSDETRALLREVPSAWRCRVEEVLLAVLVDTLSRWCGAKALRIDMEGHGREAIVEDVDLSRTVGWFTAVYPLVFDSPSDRPLDATLRMVKERLRAVPDRGLSYGLLRYCGRAEVRERLAALPQAEVLFNYLGQFGGDEAQAGGLRLVDDSVGQSRAPGGLRDHLLEVNSSVLDGELRVEWGFSQALYEEATIEGLANEFLSCLRGLIAQGQRAEGDGYSPGYSPVDFPLAKLDQGTLDRLFGSAKELEDVYPLSPLQEGLLFHTLYDPEAGEYVMQFRCSLGEDTDLDAFQRAWQQVIERHTILRTAFLWEGLEEPLQAVYKEIPLPWQTFDWRDVPEAEVEEKWKQVRIADRLRGFELSQAPLLRLAVFRLGSGEVRFVWTVHHVLIDGWSLPLLLGDVFAFYGAAIAGGEHRPQAVPPFRDYIEWLGGQDLAAAEAYWRPQLRGFKKATALPIARPAVGKPLKKGAYDQEDFLLSESLSKDLKAFAPRHSLTVGTVLQGAWALCLAELSGEHDVVFGTAASGRPAELLGSDLIVGLFLNTLVVRVQFEETSQVVPFLQALQTQQSRARQFEYTPLAKVLEWSEIEHPQPLFETFLTYQNYPVDEALRRLEVPITLRDIHWTERASFPLSLVVVPEERIKFECKYSRERFEPTAIRQLLEGYSQALSSLVANADIRLEALLEDLAKARQQRGAAQKQAFKETRRKLLRGGPRRRGSAASSPGKVNQR